jgi:hypothetical protein
MVDDSIVERALEGDHEALSTCFKEIRDQLTVTNGVRSRSFDPPSLLKIYGPVEKGIHAVAGSQLYRAGLPPGAKVWPRLEAVVSEALRAWFEDDPNSRPKWSPMRGTTLTRYAMSHSQGYVKSAVERAIRRA